MRERVDIRFPEIEGDPHMLIIKRSQLPKKERANDRKYRYSFYQAYMRNDIISAFRDILHNHILSLQNSQENELPKYHPDIEELPCYVELNPIEFPYWDDFIDAIKIGSESRSRRAPRKLKSNLWGYVFYLYNDQYAIGYVRKLSPSKVLNKTIITTLIHDGLVFDSIKEVKGIEFDGSIDFVFVVFNDEDPDIIDWGIIWNKNNFESLLDVYEYQKQKAMEVLRQCNTLPSVLMDEDLQNFKQAVESNRQLHKMLLNPVTKQYMNEVTIDDFKQVKGKFGNEVSFDIDANTGRVILPPVDSEGYIKAIREVLGVIGARFTKTINDRHISKGKPEELR